MLAATAIVGLGLAVSGCAQTMSEFAGGETTASTAPTALTPGDPAAVATARPAVLVDETTEPTSKNSATTTPMAIAPPTAYAEEPGQPVSSAAVNLNQVPEQPKAKLLSPDEKARVIAELEALAKKQSAAFGKGKKSTECADQNIDPAKRVASATGDGGC